MGNNLSHIDLQKYKDDFVQKFATKDEIAELNVIYQTRGNYAFSKDLELIYQTRGNYVLKSDLDAYQPKGNYQTQGNYVLSSDLAAYQLKGDYQVKGDYQTRGNYVLSSDLAAYELKGDYQTRGNYVLSSDLPLPANIAIKEDLSKYALISDLKTYALKSNYIFSPYKKMDTKGKIMKQKTLKECEDICKTNDKCDAFNFPVKAYNENTTGDCIIYSKVNTEQFDENSHLFYKN